MSNKSILEEAEEIVGGDRATDYGDAQESFDNIAKGWSIIVGSEITGPMVATMMIWLKMIRENNKHKRDNLVDIVGYTILLDRLQSKKNE